VQEDILEQKAPKLAKDETTKKGKASRRSAELPSGITAGSLAKAMWKAKSGGKKKATAAEGESWKQGQKEYKKLARKVIATLGRQADQTKKRGRKTKESA
jgi:hypothetical protein